jgi:hypothetical protein
MQRYLPQGTDTNRAVVSPATEEWMCDHFDMRAVHDAGMTDAQLTRYVSGLVAGLRKAGIDDPEPQIQLWCREVYTVSMGMVRDGLAPPLDHVPYWGEGRLTA